jgi:hypothetical protein
MGQCRVLDLACLDGLFSIEFALAGADTVGVEIREANVKKAMFCKDALELANLKFIQGDVREISAESLGKFDAIICSGILYHLQAPDVWQLIRNMFAMTKRLVVIDTHVALTAETNVSLEGVEYSGKQFFEHSDADSQELKAKRLWASWDNATSFWFTRPSLVNMLSRAGFSSVYECFTPVHKNFGESNIKNPGRCTFVAIKGEEQNLKTSPSANGLREDWPEGTLSYPEQRDSNPVHKRGRLSSIFKKFFG